MFRQLGVYEMELMAVLLGIQNLIVSKIILWTGIILIFDALIGPSPKLCRRATALRTTRSYFCYYSNFFSSILNFVPVIFNREFFASFQIFFFVLKLLRYFLG